MGNPRKPKALKELQETNRKDREYNTLESDMTIPVTTTTITPNQNLSGFALEYWNELIPALTNIRLIGAQEKFVLDSAFLLYQELLIIGDKIKEARDNPKSDIKYIDTLNNQLNRTSKSLQSAISLLGFSPKDRTYFKSVDSNDNNKNNNPISELINYNNRK